jgi:hypothetical protein
MFADPKKVGIRRLKRRLKAGASIVIALAAGAFLACKGGEDDPGPSPSGPDARTGPDRSGASSGSGSGSSSGSGSGSGNQTPTEATSGSAEVAPDAATRAPTDAGAPAPADAGPSDAMLVRDAAADAADAHAPRVDKKEHRKGMPVRDNLLE